MHDTCAELQQEKKKKNNINNDYKLKKNSKSYLVKGVLEMGPTARYARDTVTSHHVTSETTRHSFVTNFNPNRLDLRRWGTAEFIFAAPDYPSQILFPKALTALFQSTDVRQTAGCSIRQNDFMQCLV